MTEAFIRLYERGLLYRRYDFVNWSSSLRSTISDIEVENVIIHGSTKLHVPGYKSKVTFGRMMKLAFPMEDSSKLEIHLISFTNYILIYLSTYNHK